MSLDSLVSKPFEDATVAIGHGMELLTPTEEFRKFLEDLIGVKKDVLAVVNSLLKMSRQKRALVDAEDVPEAAPELPVAKRARKSAT